MKINKAAITLSVQSGDIESSEATRPVFIALRQKLEAHCIGPYSEEISEFAVVLRICGSIWSFDGEGLQRLRLSRKRRYITLDIVVPESRWKGVPLGEIKRYFALSVKAAVSLMLEKLEKSKVSVDACRLIADLELALGR